MERTYRIADHTILIRTLHEQMHAEAAAYAAEGTPDFTVEITQADIDTERVRNERTVQAEQRRCTTYSDAYIETLAVYRKIAEYLPRDGVILFHGSTIAVDGKAYLLTARSGTGKSTHARLWREMLGARAVMINDDKPLIRVSDDGATVYGTPWNGKHHLGINASAPLKAICILDRAEQNRIDRIEPKAAYPYLLQQIYRPDSAEAMLKTMQLINRLTEKVAFYHLYCNMDPQAARISYETMSTDANA